MLRLALLCCALAMGAARLSSPWIFEGPPGQASAPRSRGLPSRYRRGRGRAPAQSFPRATSPRSSRHPTADSAGSRGRLTLLVTTRGTHYQGKQVPVAELPALVAGLKRPVTLRFGRGTYTAPLKFKGVHGLRIESSRGQAVFSGGQRLPEGPNLSYKADGRAWEAQYPSRGNGMLMFKKCSDISVRGIRVKDKWPTGIGIKDCQKVRIEYCSFVGGTDAIHAKGSETRGITVRHCRWNQDPSQRVWHSHDWQHVHHGRFNFYNGALFQAKNIAGDVLIEHCVVRNAFNGVRIKNSQDGLTIRNVRIRHNQFYQISDNAVEPELGPHYNWVVENNKFVGFHGPISVDGVYGDKFIFRFNLFQASGMPRQQQRETPSDGSRHDGSKGLARFFKVKTMPGGLPRIRNMAVYKNILRTSTYAIRVSDSPYPNQLFPRGTNYGGAKDFYSGNTVVDPRRKLLKTW